MTKRPRPHPSELETMYPALHGALTRSVPHTGPLAGLFHDMLQSETRTKNDCMTALNGHIERRRRDLIQTFNPPREDHQPELADFDRSAERVQQAVTTVLSSSPRIA